MAPDHSALLGEAYLRQLARDSASILPQSGKDIDVIKLEILLHDLTETTISPAITIPHRAAACNVLSTFIAKCAGSPVHQVRNLLWVGQVWYHSFQAFLSRYHDSKPKPMRQLLATLSDSARRHRYLPEVGIVRTQVIKDLLVVFGRDQSSKRSPVKPAVHALTFFLSKGALTVEEIETLYSSAAGVEEQRRTTNQVQVRMIHDALQWATHDDVAPSIGPLIAHLARISEGRPHQDVQYRNADHGSEESIHSGPMWFEAVLSELSIHPDSLNNFRHYIFPSLFSESFDDFIGFLYALDYDGVLERGSNVSDPRINKINLSPGLLEDLALCVLLVGSSLGWVCPDDGISKPHIDAKRRNLTIPTSFLGGLLSRQSHKTRVAALHLLVVSMSITKPVTSKTFACLQRSLPALHADTDANFRSELFGVTQRLVDRLRAGTSTLYRDSDVKKRTTAYEPIKAVVGHVTWYLSFLRMELRPSASYQRHICGLRCLDILLRSGIDRTVSRSYRSRNTSGSSVWPFELRIVDAEMQSLLVSLLLDPFDDVRLSAAAMLRISTPCGESDVAGAGLSNDRQEALCAALSSAEELSRLSGRADQADGVAHLYSIIFDHATINQEREDWWSHQLGVLKHLVAEMERVLSILETDPAAAVSRHPLHGILTSTRYIMQRPGFYSHIRASDQIDQWQALHLRIYAILSRLWKDVYDTLCNDAPEGYMPEELEDDETGLSTKSVLSYSWRALKEAGLLIRTFVTLCPLSADTRTLMDGRQLHALGGLCFEQLVHLRHRGAFSTIAQTFLACCARSMQEAEPLPSAVNEWYERALSSVSNTATINTRRSAGLPSLIVGVLAADPSSDLFAKAISDLTRIANKPYDKTADQNEALTQVHALNCLKDVFKVSRLSERSEAYIPETLELAGTCLSSEAWGIRNSGLMLFRALLDRLLGTNDSYVDEEAPPQTHASLAKIPNLIDIILRLLTTPSAQQGPESAVAEGVFPALQLLQRAPPSPDRLREAQDAVFALVASPHWHVRDKAARAYAMLSPVDELEVTFAELLKSTTRSQNSLHGALLCAKYVLRRLLSLDCAEPLAILQALRAAAKPLYWDNRCPVTQAAFIELQCAMYRALQVTEAEVVHVQPVLVCAGSELRAMLDESRKSQAANALLCQSLARCLALEASADWVDLFSASSLAHAGGRDVIFALLEETGQLLARPRPQIAFRLRAAALCRWLFQHPDASGILDPELQLVAFKVVLGMCESDTASAELANMENRFGSVSSLAITGTSPLSQDGMVVLLATMISANTPEMALRAPTEESAFAKLVNMLQGAIREDNPLDTRMAAATATERLYLDRDQDTVLGIQSSTLIDFYLVLYDLTVDDDDDVREIAARTIGRILRRSPTQFMSQRLPLFAGSQLAGHLARHFTNSKRLATATIKRMTGVVIANGRSVSAANLLSQAQGQDNVLFAEEKHNIFVDPAREARLWSRVLTKLSRHAFSDDMVQILSDWTLDGIDTLVFKSKQTQDGPFGWSRDPDVFALGLRVIFAADALLQLALKDKRIRAIAPLIRRRLIQFLLVGRSSGVNVLWLEQTNKVLLKSVERGVVRVGNGLRAATQALRLQ